jgi:hypothetical protein
MTCQKLTLAFSTSQHCFQETCPAKTIAIKLKLHLDLRSEIESKPVVLIFVLSKYILPHSSWWQYIFCSLQWNE